MLCISVFSGGIFDLEAGILSHPDPDIGAYDIDDVRRLRAAARAKLLRSKFKPPDNKWKAPKRNNGGCNRRCPKDFLLHNQSYPTIRYSPAADGLYCVECSIFRTDEGQLVAEPLNDWSNAAKRIEKHYKTPEHLAACRKAREFFNIFDKQAPNIIEQQERSSERDRQVRRSAIKSIGRNILFLGRQGLAIRGKTDERRNFQATLNLQQETDSDLKEHLSKAKAREKYTSHEIQNEMIELQASQVTNKILHKVSKAKWYSLMADESADISKTEQVALILRYLVDTPKGVRVREDFLRFVATGSTTGEALTQLILEKLKQWNLALGWMVGQGYDGAGNMKGEYSGVQARISALNPDAVFIHCRNHCLNLALIHSCTVPSIRNMYNTLEEMLKFITASAKRQAIYLQQTGGKNKLHRFCPTRWSHHSEVVAMVIKNYEAILDTLEVLQRDTDKDVARDAFAYSKALQSFEFLMCLFIADDVMAPMQPIALALQAEEMDLVRASERAARVISLLESDRSDSDSSFSRIYDRAVAFAGEHQILPSTPRIVGRQKHRANVITETPFDHYRINAYHTFLDFLIRELKEWLVKPLPRLKAEYLLSHKLPLLTPEIWSEIKKTYGHLLPNPSALDSELKSWKHDINTGHVVATDLFQAIDSSPFLPNLNNIFRILLTMPVSAASCERSFSTLRRLKTYLRNTMGNDRLSSLALLYIHQDIEVSIEQFLEDFDDGSRRIKL